MADSVLQTELFGVESSLDSPPAEPAGEGVLRVLSWNVRHLLGEPLRVFRAIAATRADVVCLQEGPRYRGSRARLAWFARSCGLYAVTGGRVSAGVCLMASARVRVEHASSQALPTPGPSLTRNPNTLIPMPRGVARAMVSLPGTAAIGVASIHLPTVADQRDLHVPMVLRWPDGRPLDVVGGDINDVPGSSAWTSLLAGLRDPGADGSYPTFPAHDPQHRLDGVLVRPDLPVVRYGWPVGVVEEDVYKGTDHRPVFADIVLPPA